MHYFKGSKILVKVLNPNNLVVIAWIVKFNLKKKKKQVISGTM